jgi:hypothetical protein
METFPENIVKVFSGILSQIHDYKKIETMKSARGICEECVNNKSKIIPDFLVISYCSHNQAGGFFNIKDRRWQILTPISKEEFAVYVQEILGLCNESLNKILDKVFEQLPGKET